MLSQKPTLMRQPPRPTSDTLLRVGIAKDLHRTRLFQIQDGDGVLRWLREEGRQSFANGENWYLVTNSIEHHSILPVIIKDYRCAGGSAWFARLGTIIKLLETRNYREFDTITDTRLLGIGDFFRQAAGPRERPFTTAQRGRIEEMLMSRRDRRLPTILQVQNPNRRKIDFMPWWNQDTMDQLRMRTFDVSSASSHS